jgi:hypothetical protein
MITLIRPGLWRHASGASIFWDNSHSTRKDVGTYRVMITDCLASLDPKRYRSLDHAKTALLKQVGGN